MSCWDILGIASTDNKRAIKRAYAKALALHHPEDDPAGAQRVQEAYEEAMAYACGKAASPEALDIDGGDSAHQAAHSGVRVETRSREPFGSDPAPDSTEHLPLCDSHPASDEVPSYMAEERRRRERMDVDAAAWLESRAAMTREHIAASSERAALVLDGGDLLPPLAYWAVEAFDERLSHIVAPAAGCCEDMTVLESYVRKLPATEAVSTRQVCTERIAALQACRSRRKMRTRALVFAVCSGLFLAAFLGRGLLDAGDQRATQDRGQAVQHSVQLSEEMVGESQRRHEEREAIERALLEHREQNDAFICQELACQYGQEFTIDSSALDVAFPPMGDTPGRATCTAVASDGTVYTALVEYGTDGVAIELVMAEAA